MAYALARDDDTVEAGMRRIAAEQIERAIAEIDDTGLDRHETVHQVRKRCKKVRGLVRLVRPAFAHYKAENAAYRDAARTLSRFREYLALIETCDALAAHTDGGADGVALASVRAVLDARRAEVDRDPAELEVALAGFREAMVAARERVEGWTLKKNGFKAIKGGLRATYERGVVALDEAQADPIPVRMHEWRKRVKYHWYHLRLLENVWPAMLAAREKAADDLGEMLGDDHNFAVLGATIAADPDAFGDSGPVVAALIERRGAELRRAAFSLGRRLYAEDPAELVERFRVYWKEWRASEAAEPPSVPAALQPA